MWGATLRGGRRGSAGAMRSGGRCTSCGDQCCGRTCTRTRTEFPRACYMPGRGPGRMRSRAVPLHVLQLQGDCSCAHLPLPRPTTHTANQRPAAPSPSPGVRVFALNSVEGWVHCTRGGGRGAVGVAYHGMYQRLRQRLSKGQPWQNFYSLSKRARPWLSSRRGRPQSDKIPRTQWWRVLRTLAFFFLVLLHYCTFHSEVSIRA